MKFRLAVIEGNIKSNEQNLNHITCRHVEMLKRDLKSFPQIYLCFLYIYTYNSIKIINEHHKLCVDIHFTTSENPFHFFLAVANPYTQNQHFLLFDIVSNYMLKYVKSHGFARI